MEPVGIVVGVLSIAESCLTNGRSLVQKFKTYKNTDTALGESMLEIQHYWMTIEMELEILRHISPSLDDRLQLHFTALLQQLRIKLEQAIVTLDAVIGERPQRRSFSSLLRKKGKVNKMKFAATGKKSLDESVRELEKWHSMFLQSWFLLALVRDTALDSQLTDQRASQSAPVSTLKDLRNAIELSRGGHHKTSPFMLESDLPSKRSPLLHGVGEIADDERTGESLFVDTVALDPREDVNAKSKHVRDLARILAAVDPVTFGILSCSGVVRVQNSAGRIERFHLIFRMPACVDRPQSLRSLLLAGAIGEDYHYPLEERFLLAKLLARAVMFVHTADFVHKNIRPDTVIIVRTEENKRGVPFLVGFEKFRPSDGNSHRTGDLNEASNLYRHPNRQGSHPEDNYLMQHDIYSLGVCLLEIGLWNSFVIPAIHSPGIFNISSMLELPPEMAYRPSKAAYERKEKLVSMAKHELPRTMGSRYTKLVVSCLNCLDQGNEFGDVGELYDTDGILVGVRYIEKVLEKLEGIAI
ncbi:HET-s/LopB domain protein [Wilcoxina mikolae CBS 423.85]|nr:HET-s/LopB domain protein [Wilcoxina mikolae CBS 423.85]